VVTSSTHPEVYQQYTPWGIPASLRT